MADILETNNKILRILLYGNLIGLIISIFYISREVIIPLLILNVILLSTYMIIKKNYLLIKGLSVTRGLFKKLNKKVEALN
jgi:hypothetical protein